MGIVERLVPDESSSLPALLSMTATAIESGALLDCYERAVVDDALTWTF